MERHKSCVADHYLQRLRMLVRIQPPLQSRLTTKTGLNMEMLIVGVLYSAAWGLIWLILTKIT